jgi:hypothetical protein
LANNTKIQILNINEFNRSINELALLTKREVGKVVRNAAKDFVRAAYNATPLSATTRVSKSTGQFLKKITDRSGVIRVIPSDKPQSIQGRGFAKSGWIKPMIALGITTNKWAGKATGKAESFSDYRGKLEGEAPFVEMANMVPYIGKLDRGSETNPPYNIEAIGFAKAQANITRAIQKLKNQQEQKWRF